MTQNTLTNLLRNYSLHSSKKNTSESGDFRDVPVEQLSEYWTC